MSRSSHSLIIVLAVCVFVFSATPAYAAKDDCLAKDQRSAEQQKVYKKILRRSKKKFSGDKAKQKNFRNKQCGVPGGQDPDLDGIQTAPKKASKATDNCSTVFNSDQADSDSDGIGNVCDNCPNTSNADQADSDNDGLGNVCDNCANAANPSQTDSDDDGMGDACEIIDLAVASGSGDQIAIFYDARNKGPIGVPDVVLGPVFSNMAVLDRTSSIKLVDNRLITTSRDSDEIFIWNDFTNLTDQQPPDVVLGPASGLAAPCDTLDRPHHLIVYDGKLIFNTLSGNDCIFIYNDISTLTTGDPADVGIDLQGQGLDNPAGLTAFGEGTSSTLLYSFDVDNAQGIFERYAFKNIASLTSASTPDFSFFTYGNKATLIDGQLFSHGGDGTVISIYNSPDMLSANSIPDLFLWSRPEFDDFEQPRGLVRVSNGNTSRLFVSSRNGGDDFDEHFSIVGYDYPLTNGQSPSVRLGEFGGPFQIEDVEEMLAIGGSLFIGSEGDGLVHVYNNPLSLTDNAASDSILVAQATASKQSKLAARQR